MVKCPYCGKVKDPYDIMGDSDWDDQSDDWYEVECSCGRWYKIRQWDAEIIRHFEVKEGESWDRDSLTRNPAGDNSKPPEDPLVHKTECPFCHANFFCEIKGLKADLEFLFEGFGQEAYQLMGSKEIKRYDELKEKYIGKEPKNE